MMNISTCIHCISSRWRCGTYRGRKLYKVLHPGVEALGYVKRTTPALLASTSFCNVVFSPSLVSISPPKPARVILLPEATELAEGAPFAGSAGLSTVTSLTLAAAAFAGAFLGGGAGAASAGALRLRNSTIMMLRGAEMSKNNCNCRPV